MNAATPNHPLKIATPPPQAFEQRSVHNNECKHVQTTRILGRKMKSKHAEISCTTSHLESFMASENRSTVKKKVTLSRVCASLDNC